MSFGKDQTSKLRKRKSSSCTTGSHKKRRHFVVGSSPHRTRSDAQPSSSYKSTEEFQFPSYEGYSRTNYGKILHIADTPANVAVLKKISNYSMDRLIGEIGQNLSNGLQALSQNHQKMMEDNDSLKSQLRHANLKSSSYCTDLNMLRGTNKCLREDLEVKVKLINDLQVKLRDSREDQSKANTTKEIAERETKTLKNALDVPDTSYTIVVEELKSLKKEYDMLVSRPSIVDATIENEELRQQIEKLSKETSELKGQVFELESFREKIDTFHNEFVGNINDYNELVQSGPEVFPDFEAYKVHQWVQDHPILVEKLLKKWEDDEEEEVEGGDNDESKVNAAKEIAERETKTLKNALDASDTSHTTVVEELKSPKKEYDMLVSRPSIVDVTIENEELRQQIEKLSKETSDFKGQVSELESFREKMDTFHNEFVGNINDYNELVQFGPVVFQDFETYKVHQWVQDHPVLVEKLKWEDDEEKEVEGDDNDETESVIGDENFSVQNQDNVVTKNLSNTNLSTPASSPLKL